MGLDMYLYRKTYVKNWDFMKPENKVHIEISGNQEKIGHIEVDKISSIVEEVAYWRKANQIHAWFVDKCQDGVDDCRDGYVEPERLKELLDLCKRVLAEPELGQSLLPTQSGFFFGSTGYDEYYMEDIKLTIEQLTPLVENEKIFADYYYHSSW